MFPFSPDRSGNPLLPGFGSKDCNGEREPSLQECLLMLLQKKELLIENKIALFVFHILLDVIEGIALLDIARMESFLKPVDALLRGAVSKRIGDNLTLHFLLDGVVAYGLRGA
ncbi:hypothetical protein FLB_08810 [Flavobacterium succinicans]|uniref:Uncharacterized protein n=1 Tax=Flavobacterium succinicans TaxID=29536 RepID=A0A199XTQ9_9FLAO|nr:hypothetical protein FLB_08810 [Flavobacterium succinicans]